MIILPYLKHVPRIGLEVLAHPASAIIGRAHIGSGCTLGEFTVVRADGEDVQIGIGCWFGEGSTVHIANQRYPAVVGAQVTVGSYSLIHACTVGDYCVIGEQSVVMDGSILGAGSVIAAASVVTPGKTLEGGWLYAGVPARPVKRVPRALVESLHRSMRAGLRTEGWPIFAATSWQGPQHVPGIGPESILSEGAYVAPTASIAGRVTLAARSSVWFGVEIDAGDACINIGEQTNVQDNSRLYADTPGENILIGPRVTIGHNVRIFASTIEEGAIIGMGAVIGKGTVVRAGGCVAAGSVTEPGTEVAAGHVWSGRPARATRELSERNREDLARAAQTYVEYSKNYLAQEVYQ
jgi:carbonic anhydrase/acetyltransferase-like protein (isoleucine patch superfamily)